MGARRPREGVRADCEASLAALDGLPIDLYLLHAPDPRTPWATSVRALARSCDEGLVAARRPLEREPPAARRGARARAHRGGRDRARPVRRPRASGWRRRSLRGDRDRGARPLAARRPAARAVARPPSGAGRLAAAHDATAAEVALAWLLGLAPARRRDPGRAAARDGALGRASRVDRSSAPRSASASRRSERGARDSGRPAATERSCS